MSSFIENKCECSYHLLKQAIDKSSTFFVYAVITVYLLNFRFEFMVNVKSKCPLLCLLVSHGIQIFLEQSSIHFKIYFMQKSWID